MLRSPATASYSPVEETPIPNLHRTPNILTPLTPLFNPVRHSSDLRSHILPRIACSHDGNVDTDEDVCLLHGQTDHGHLDPSEFGKFVHSGNSFWCGADAAVGLLRGGYEVGG
jgi:hypothetical protein